MHNKLFFIHQKKIIVCMLLLPSVHDFMWSVRHLIVSCVMRCFLIRSSLLYVKCVNLNLLRLIVKANSLVTQIFNTLNFRRRRRADWCTNSESVLKLPWKRHWLQISYGTGEKSMPIFARTKMLLATRKGNEANCVTS